MDRTFKHPQIFSDVLALCQVYYPLHSNLPKPFRFAVGERMLMELAECMRLIVLANSVDKSMPAGRSEGAALVKRVRASVEVMRGFLLMAWKLKFISHGAVTEVSLRLEAIGKQAARWQQWFEGPLTTAADVAEAIA
jgi:hypothetical protein